MVPTSHTPGPTGGHGTGETGTGGMVGGHCGEGANCKLQLSRGTASGCSLRGGGGGGAGDEPCPQPELEGWGEAWPRGGLPRMGRLLTRLPGAPLLQDDWSCILSRLKSVTSSLAYTAYGETCEAVRILGGAVTLHSHLFLMGNPQPQPRG